MSNTILKIILLLGLCLGCSRQPVGSTATMVVKQQDIDNKNKKLDQGSPLTTKDNDSQSSKSEQAISSKVPDKLKLSMSVVDKGTTLEIRNLETSKSLTLSPSVFTIYDKKSPKRALKKTYRSEYQQQPILNWSFDRDEPHKAWAKLDIQDAEWTLEVHIRNEHPQIQVFTHISYNSPRYVGLEAVELAIEVDRAKVLNRAFELVPVDNEQVIDRWTPQFTFLKQEKQNLTLIGHAQSLAVKYQEHLYDSEATDEVEKIRKVHVRYDLDNARNHPWKPFRKCWSKYRSSQEKERDEMSAQYKDSSSPRAKQLLFEIEFQDLDLLRPLRVPEGYKSAVIFTDHADQSSYKKLKTLMYGTSAKKKRKNAPKGFAGHGLSMTKSVFGHQTKQSTYDPQLSNSTYLKLVKQLLKDGIEIVPHSVSGYKDNRLINEKWFEEYNKIAKSASWIDHQPSTNCEAISNQGTNPKNDKYYVIDLMKKYNYRYIWAALDLNKPLDELNMFDPKRNRSHTPVLYTHNKVDHLGELWLYPSLWSTLSFKKFRRLYSEKNLRTLSENRGIHIAHVYLDTYTKKGRMANKSLMQKKGKDLILKPKADALFKSFKAFQDERLILFAGIEKIGDYLVGMDKLRITYQPTQVTITNTGTQAIKGASFMLPGLYKVETNQGQINSEQDETRKVTNLWFDIDGEESVTLTFQKNKKLKTFIYE